MKLRMIAIPKRQRLLYEQMEMLAEESKTALPGCESGYTQAMVEASKEISRIMALRLLLCSFTYFLFYSEKLIIKVCRR